MGEDYHMLVVPYRSLPVLPDLGVFHHLNSSGLPNIHSAHEDGYSSV